MHLGPERVRAHGPCVPEDQERLLAATDGHVEPPRVLGEAYGLRSATVTPWTMIKKLLHINEIQALE